MTTEQRIEKLEGQLARVKWFNRCLIACIILSLGVWFILKTFDPEMAWAGSGAKVIRANSFFLQDENGNIRAGLDMLKDGPYLSLSNENGKHCAVFRVSKDRPELILSDDNGTTRVALTVGKVGPGLFMSDENGKFRAAFRVSKDGPELSLADPDMIYRAAMTVGKDGPELSLRDETFKEIWSAP